MCDIPTQIEAHSFSDGVYRRFAFNKSSARPLRV
jgi:hypothetical protein